MKLIAYLLDILIPRFVTDYYAALIIDEHTVETLHMLDEFPEKFTGEYDCVMEIRCFNFFGMGLFNNVYLWVVDDTQV